MFDPLFAETKSKFEKALAALQNAFAHIRTGRASPAMIEHIQVEAYGALMPLNQCAAITVPEPMQLAIKPWDKNLVKAIEKAITAANLGLTPSNDGQIVRVQLPPLSQERRRQLAAQAKEESEKAKVAMRNVRRDAIKQLETQAKEQKISEDVVKKARERLDALLKDYEQMVEKRLSEKTKDILEG
ncbi:MAG: ribosome recycling factor [Planctomycetota bacterium]|nr:ribosome recycling factor [Planctomycetota bacterium]MCX8039720.1 ribosome recycling factor [Planctomycetota bacterium]MDW8373254.1 ribosome recycling factor [Planctomycetota bacterium]